MPPNWTQTGRLPGTRSLGPLTLPRPAMPSLWMQAAVSIWEAPATQAGARPSGLSPPVIRSSLPNSSPTERLLGTRTSGRLTATQLLSMRLAMFMKPASLMRLGGHPFALTIAGDFSMPSWPRSRFRGMMFPCRSMPQLPLPLPLPLRHPAQHQPRLPRQGQLVPIEIEMT